MKKTLKNIMSEDLKNLTESRQTNQTHLSEAEIFACSMVKKYDKSVAVCESTANLWLKTHKEFETV